MSRAMRRLASGFRHALSTPNSSSTKGQMCAIHYGGCYTLSAFPTVNYDVVNCDYLCDFGQVGRL